MPLFAAKVDRLAADEERRSAPGHLQIAIEASPRCLTADRHVANHAMIMLHQAGIRIQRKGRLLWPLLPIGPPNINEESIVGICVAGSAA
jgi:hypothetical protein